MSAENPGFIRRAWQRMEDDAHIERIVNQTLNTPDPEVLEEARRGWEHQFTLPISQRSRAWWLEVGLGKVVNVVVVLVALYVIVSWIF